MGIIQCVAVQRDHYRTICQMAAQKAYLMATDGLPKQGHSIRSQPPHVGWTFDNHDRTSGVDRLRQPIKQVAFVHAGHRQIFGAARSRVDFTSLPASQNRSRRRIEVYLILIDRDDKTLIKPWRNILA